MKYSLGFLAVLGVFVEGAASKAVASPLSIQVSCTNVRVEDISPKDLAFGAKALEVSFNHVHRGGADGTTLVEVTATPLAAFVQDSTRGLRGDNCCQCRSCGGNEKSQAGPSLVFAAQVLESDLGLGRCRFCGRDDDATELLGEAKMKRWEQELTAIFAMAPYESLRQAEDCHIAMASRSGQGRQCKICGNDDTLVQSEAVTVNVQCENLDLKDMPVSALSATTKALAESFNAIHSVEGNELGDVVLVGPRLSFGGHGGDHTSLKRCRFCGRDDDAWFVPDAQTSLGSNDPLTSEYAIEFAALKRCRFCGRDDDATATTLGAFSAAAAAHRAWEELFAATMMKAGLQAGACKLVLTEDATA